MQQGWPWSLIAVVGRCCLCVWRKTGDLSWGTSCQPNIPHTSKSWKNPARGFVNLVAWQAQHVFPIRFPTSPSFQAPSPYPQGTKTGVNGTIGSYKGLSSPPKAPGSSGQAGLILHGLWDFHTLTRPHNSPICPRNVERKLLQQWLLRHRPWMDAALLSVAPSQVSPSQLSRNKSPAWEA